MTPAMASPTRMTPQRPLGPRSALSCACADPKPQRLTGTVGQAQHQFRQRGRRGLGRSAGWQRSAPGPPGSFARPRAASATASQCLQRKPAAQASQVLRYDTVKQKPCRQRMQHREIQTERPCAHALSSADPHAGGCTFEETAMMTCCSKPNPERQAPPGATSNRHGQAPPRAPLL